MPLASKSHLRKLISPVRNPTYNIYIYFLLLYTLLSKKKTGKKVWQEVLNLT